MTETHLDKLTQINLEDLVTSFGLKGGSLPARLLQKVFFKYARSFAQQMTEFDEQVGKCGLAEGARLALRKYFSDMRVYGEDRVPASGFLALSNHPGLSDSLATFAALNRRDLKIIALKRPFLEALTNVSKQLFYLNEDAASRMRLVRQVSTHLRNSGAVLTYPAGHIEPDPDVHTDAVDSLSQWTNSVGVFIRMAPETPILPVLVRGVVWKKALHHPLTRVRRTRLDREALAAALQLFVHLNRKIDDVRVRVQIGNPIYANKIASTETQVIHRAVLTEMKQLIENPPQGEGLPLL